MARQVAVLDQKDLAIAAKDFIRNHMQLIPDENVKFVIDNGDPGHYADMGPTVSAEVYATKPAANDASNLPPMSNKVEGGGHFGLG